MHTKAPIATAKRRYRTHLGPRFSEGSRQIWLRLGAAHETPENFAARVGLPRGSLHRWMYGDYAPSLEIALLFKREMGIEPELFSKAPHRPFVPPAARRAA